MEKPEINIVWFRRDLRLIDHGALSAAGQKGSPVLCLFIFDDDILQELPKNDPRVNFIYDQLHQLHLELGKWGSGFCIKRGKPTQVWAEMMKEYRVNAVYASEDYEPYAIKRDQAIESIVQSHGASFHLVKDQVIFHKDEIVKDDGKPYTVYTPYKNKWLRHFETRLTHSLDEGPVNYHPSKAPFPSRSQLGIEESAIKVKTFQTHQLFNYDEVRNFPAKDAGSYLSPHLRFGTVSIREIVREALDKNETFLSELIWREFFMQILWHFPRVVDESFRPAYDRIPWRNDQKEFDRWCKGETGYPMVDAGMRELNETGYMHNRVRMVVASFLCKHLLIDWRWGEAYFAKKLLDFDLSANNGNWQWAAGTGCDAAPYFRVFNPSEQIKKFDPDLKYIRAWVKDLDELTYPRPIVEHKMARERAISTYKLALAQEN